MRSQFSTMIIGAQRTGKTLFALQMIEKYPKPVLAVVPDDNEQKFTKFKLIGIDEIKKVRGRCKIVFDRDDKDFLKTIRNNFLNGCLIFDDTKFCIRPWNYYDFEDIVGRKRQSNIDSIFMYHGFDRIPDFFWNYSTHMVLFKTLSSEGSSKQNQKRQQEVNLLAATNPHANKIYQLN